MNYEDEWNYTVSTIKAILVSRNWSVSRLGDEVNMDKAVISRLLSSKQRNMQYRTLFKIADALGVAMSELVR